MTNSSDVANGAPTSRRRARRLVIDRAPEVSEVQHRLENDRRRYRAGMVDPGQFAAALAVEFARRQHGGRNCGVASISVFEIPGIRHRHGDPYVFDRVTELIDVVTGTLVASDVFTVDETGDILVLGRDDTVGALIERTQEVCRRIAGRRFDADGEALLLTPSAGVATLDDGDTAAEVVGHAVDAREVAGGYLDLRVHRWQPVMSAETVGRAGEPAASTGRQVAKQGARTAVQVLATYVLGLVVPFCAYWFFDRVVGVDLTAGAALVFVAILVLAGLVTVVEGRLAIGQREPPDVEVYPDASAIVCARLPDDAGTIVETLEAFLGQDYPGRLQVVLAYDTPGPMPIERSLDALADRHPDLEVVRVEGSTSKAQNVNAVLHMAIGEFTGIFDAGHLPRPGSFERAWRWLASGYDVVQGHRLVRNGDETWLAHMVAVEFESIYAVAQPGRARLHRFGVFGGSNGYWRTGLLHETRMRGSMLTEDIDSSMRIVERGIKIRSDREIVSRELGAATVRQLWDQRLRWARGWVQVTKQHSLRVWRSPGLTLRQKCGATYLLGWRELSAWLSLQVVPIVAYWHLVRGESLTSWPVALCVGVFVLHAGPTRTWYSYRLADPEIKQHRSWFWGYLLYSTVVHTELEHLITRLAHVKEFVGERVSAPAPPREWRVELDDELDVTDDGARDARSDDAGSDDAGSDDATPERGRLSPQRVRQVRGTASIDRRRVRGAIAGLDEPDPPLGPGVITGEPLVPSSAGLVDATDGFEWPVRRRGSAAAVMGDRAGLDRPSSPVAGEPLLASRQDLRGADSVGGSRRQPASESATLAQLVIALRNASMAGERLISLGDVRPDGSEVIRPPVGHDTGSDFELPRRRRPVIGEDVAVSPPVGGASPPAPGETSEPDLPVRGRTPGE